MYYNISNLLSFCVVQARELKSVNLDCTGHFIKLVLQSNHINKLNPYNQVSSSMHIVVSPLIYCSLHQVSIVAINVIGDQSKTARVGVTSSLTTNILHFVGRGTRDVSYWTKLH